MTATAADHDISGFSLGQRELFAALADLPNGYPADQADDNAEDREPNANKRADLHDLVAYFADVSDQVLRTVANRIEAAYAFAKCEEQMQACFKAAHRAGLHVEALTFLTLGKLLPYGGRGNDDYYLDDTYDYDVLRNMIDAILKTDPNAPPIANRDHVFDLQEVVTETFDEMLRTAIGNNRAAAAWAGTYKLRS